MLLNSIIFYNFKFLKQDIKKKAFFNIYIAYPKNIMAKLNLTNILYNFLFLLFVYLKLLK
jgi:hypothetical protein